MSGIPNAIGPLSVRYAAQIRELLFMQAIERMAAAEEAARSSEKRAEKLESAARSEPEAREPDPAVKVDIETKDLPEPIVLPERSAPEPVAPAQLVDIQA